MSESASESPPLSTKLKGRAFRHACVLEAAPHVFFERLHRKHGDIVFFRSGWADKRKSCAVSDADLIRDISEGERWRILNRSPRTLSWGSPYMPEPGLARCGNAGHERKNAVVASLFADERKGGQIDIMLRHISACSTIGVTENGSTLGPRCTASRPPS